MELFVKRRRILGLFALTFALLFSGLMLFEDSDVSEAAITNGNIMKDTTDIGDWTYDDVTKDLKLTFAENQVPTALSGSPPGSDVQSVTVIGYTKDISGVLPSLSINCDKVFYQGDMPKHTNNVGIGTWKYDVSDGVMTFTRSSSANGHSLYNYASLSDHTAWFDYFFKGSVDKVIIDEYRDQGKYLFNDFPALKTVISNSMTGIVREMFQNTGVENIECTSTGFNAIGNNILTGNTSIKTVNFPNASVGSYAFDGCISLTTVNIGSNASTGAYSFRNCIYLTTINSDDLGTIGSHAFENCTSLSISSFSNVTSLGDYSFNGCTGITSVTMPKLTTVSYDGFRGSSVSGALDFPQLISLGERGFYSCTGVTSISMPKITSISYNAFEGCSALTSVTLSEDLTSLGSSAFYKCANLANVSPLGKIADIKEGTFRESGVQTIVIPDTVSQIGNFAFRDSALQSIIIPGSVKIIGAGAFQNCLRLAELEFEEGLETIRYDAFYNCPAILGADDGDDGYLLTFPASLKTIENNSFRDCRSLTKVSFASGSMLETIGNLAFYGCNNLSGNIVFGNYLNSIGSQAFESTIITSLEFGSSNTVIGSYAFRYCKSLDSLDLGDGVISIGNQAFHQCHSLRGTVSGPDVSPLAIPDKLVTLEEHAFNDCKSLVGVNFSHSSQLTTMGTRAFYGCLSMSGEVSIPDSLTIISKEVFSQCSNIQTLTIGTGVTEIGESAFSGCIALTTVTDSGMSVERIGNSSFNSCRSLTSVTFDNVTAIGERAFFEAKALSGASFRNTTTIGTYAFYNCNSLTSITMPAVVSIDANAFQICSLLVGTNGGNISTDNLKTIARYAFDGCNALVGITGNSIETIGEKAFQNCKAMNCSLNMPNVITIGDYAFTETKISAFSFGPALEIIGIDAILKNTNLASITVDPANTHYTTVDGVLYDKSVTALMIYPAKMAKTDLTIPSTVNTIYKYALYGSALSGVLTISENVTAIGERAFANSPNISEVIVKCTGASVLIGTGGSNNAFYDCPAIKKLTVPNTVKLDHVFTSSTKIKDFRFTGSGASGLDANYYQNNWRYMPWSWWNSSDWQISIIFDGGITSVDPYMFYRDHVDYATIKSVVFADSIRTIGTNAFYNCNKIETLSLPDSLTTMGSKAFYNCTAVKNLTLPISFKFALGAGDNNNITHINTLRFTKGSGIGADYVSSEQENLFWSKSSGYNLTLDEGIISIGDYSYIHPSSTVSFPTSLRSVGEKAFSGSAVSVLNFNSGLETIEKGAFESCLGITSLVLPDSITSIGIDAFGSCSYLNTVKMPVTVEYKAAMFTNCPIHTFSFTGGSDGDGFSYSEESSKLTPWYVSTRTRDISVSFSGVSSVGNHMFNGCGYSDGSNTYGIVGALLFASPLTSVGERSFFGCIKISSVTLGSVTDVGSEAFSGCTSITDLVIGESIQTVEDGAFSGCTGLKNLTLPISMDAVRNENKPIFGDCTALRNLTFTGVNGNPYSDSGNSDFKLTPWYFSRNNPISLTLSESIKTIGSYTFSGCTGINGGLTIGEGVTSVGGYAFRGCTGITGLDIKSATTSLGGCAFADCTGLRELTIPASINAAGSTAAPTFNNCTGIKKLRLTGSGGMDYSPGQYTVTPWYFSRGNTITLTVEDSVTKIGDNMFRDCTNLTGNGGNISLPHVTSIGNYAFCGCTRMMSVSGEDVTVTGTNIFENCTGLTSATFPKVVNVPSSTFCGCTAISGITLGVVKTIGDSAFENTTELSSINGTPSISLPEITSIGSSAFKKSGITTISVGKETVGLAMGNYVFADCERLDRLTVDGIIADFQVNTLRSGDSSFNSQLTTLAVRHAIQFSASLSDNFQQLREVDISGSTKFGSTEGTFKNCTSLVTVTLYDGDSTIVLPKSMFEGCTSLKNVNLDRTELRSGREFLGCTALESVELPISPQIASESFSGCTHLTHFNAPAATVIQNAAFAGAGFSNITELMFPEVTSVGERAFEGCLNLSSVDLSSKTTSTGAGSFRGCVGLTTFNAEGLGSISEEMFRGCSILNNVTADAVTHISARAFFGCYSLTTIELPAAIYVGEGSISEVDSDPVTTPAVFFGCSALSTVKMPLLKTIGPMAFYNCSNLVTFNIPGKFSITNAESIGLAAFAGTGARDVRLGNTEDLNVEDMAFYGCTDLKTFSAPTLTSMPAGIFGNVGKEKPVLTTELVTVDVPAVTTFDADLHGCTNLKNVTATSATSFADGVFYGCTSLLSMNMPAAQSLGDSTFEGCASLATVSAPSVREIGDRTFYGCTLLKNFNSSSNVVSLAEIEEVGDKAFASCTAITEVVLGGNLSEMGSGAFFGCTAIARLSLPMSVDSVGDVSSPVFEGCTGISSVKFTGSGNGYDYTEENFDKTPWSLSTKPVVSIDFGNSASIGNYTFRGLTALQGPVVITIPVGEHAFEDCTGIKNLTLRSGSDLSESSFKGCTALLSLDVVAEADSVVSPKHPAFEGCASLTSLKLSGTVGHEYTEDDYKFTPWYLSRDHAIAITLADSVTSIGANTFRDCTGFSGNLVLSPAISHIGESAFKGCYFIISLEIKNPSAVLGSESFSGCTGIASLDIPIEIDTVRNDGDPAFKGCTGITSVNFTGATGVDYSDHPGPENRCYNNTPWYISGAAGNTLTITFYYTVTHIGNNAFRDCASIAGNVEIPSSVDGIGDHAFSGCENIQSLVIPRSIPIGKNAFTGCSGIQTLSLPISLNSVGPDANSPIFGGCSGLTEIVFIASYDRGFDYDTTTYKSTPWYLSKVNSLSVTFSSGIPYIGNYTFYGCTGLGGNIVCPDSVNEIGENAFYGTNITGFTGPKVDSVGKSAFENCNKLSNVSLTSMTEIGEAVFSGCSVLESAVFGECTSIGARAFKESGIKRINDAGLGNIVNLPSLRSIGDFAFQNSAVEKVKLGAEGTALVMGEGVFDRCNSLIELRVYGMISELPSSTFAVGGTPFSSKLKRLILPFVNSFRMDMSHGFTDLEEVDISSATTLGPEGQFRNCTSLQKVTLYRGDSRSVTLSKSMFEGCTSLTTINLERANMIQQNGREFFGCSQLSSVVMNVSLVISPSAFEGCTSLTSFTASSATAVGARAFAGSGLVSATTAMMPALSTVGTSAFEGCGSLASVTLTAQSFGENVFKNCTVLTSFAGANLQAVSKGMFSGCVSLNSVTIDNAESIGVLAFQNCSALTSLNLPKVTRIGQEVTGMLSSSESSRYSVFGGCEGLSTVTAPLLKSVGDLAFYGCANLSSINDSNKFTLTGVTYIGSYSFAGTGARDVVVGNPGGIRGIGDFAFNGCGSLRSFASPSLTVLPANLFNDPSAPCKVPLLETMDVPSVVSFFADLHGCSMLANVALGSAETFSAHAFDGCTTLVSVDLPKATSLSDYLFNGCIALTSVDAPKVTSVGDHSFFGCMSLTTVKAKQIVSVGDYAFSGCVQLGDPNSGTGLNPDTGLNPFIRISNIGDNAFENTAFSDIVLGPRTSTLGQSAFADCVSLRSLVLPDSLTSVGAYAFKNCPLEKIYVSAKTTGFGSRAFDYTGVPSMTAASFWFNGTVGTSMEGIIVPVSGMTVTVHANKDSENSFPASFTFVEEVSSTVTVAMSASTFSSKGIYGGKIVMPFDGGAGSYTDLYITMVSSGVTLKVYASEEDFSNSRTAMSGSAVPVYPLKEGATVAFTGNTDDVGDREFEVTSNAGTSPLSQTAHYGCKMTVPKFDNTNLIVLTIAIHRNNGEIFYINKEATTIYAGYIFRNFELGSENMDVEVTLTNGSTTVNVRVYYNSLFGVRASFKNVGDYDVMQGLQVASAGFTFVGWFDGNGDAVTGESRFVAGQTYTARFNPEEYTLTFSGDNTQGHGPITLRGPYKFTVGENPVSGLTLGYNDETYPDDPKDISFIVRGYKVTKYYNTSGLSDIVSGQIFTDDLNIRVFFEERTFEITLRFHGEGEATVNEDFEIPSSGDVGMWTEYGVHMRGTEHINENVYRDGDKIVGIKYSRLADTFRIPTPLHDEYSYENTSDTLGNSITSVRYELFGDTSDSAEIIYHVKSGIYRIAFVLNDDGGNAIPGERTSCEIDGYFNVPPSLDYYTKSGYVFAGYSIEGSTDGATYNPGSQYKLTAEMASHAVKCYITMVGQWTPLEYTLNYDMGSGYTGDVPEPQTGVVVNIEGGVVIPEVAAPVGYAVKYWYWSFDLSATEHFTENFTLTKKMIDDYAGGGTTLTLHVGWQPKTYTFRVDTTGMDETQANALRDNYPDRNAVFGTSTTSVWDVGGYTLNMHTTFGGWQVGSTVYSSASAVEVNAELAAIGDANGGVILFKMIWKEISFRLTYNENGGMVFGSKPNDSYYKYGDPITLWEPGTTQLVRAGYTFGGWSYSHDGAPWNGTVFDYTLAGIAHANGDKATMYAVWDRQTYNITYDLNNGTAGASTPRTVYYGTEVYIDLPSRSGYVFAGWVASDNLSSGAMYMGDGGYRAWNGKQVVSTSFMNLTDELDGTIRLSAVWERATYNISVNWNDGEGTYILNDPQVSLGSAIPLPSVSNTSRTGYTFAGWVAGEGDTAVLKEGDILTQERAPDSGDKFVLYAFWDPIDYTVQYRDRDTQSYRSVSTEYGNPVNILPGARSGFEFAGWRISVGGDVRIPVSSMDGENWNRIGDLGHADGRFFKNLTVTDGDVVTFDAIWNPLNYSIVYDPNGSSAEPPVDSGVYRVGDAITLADYTELGRFGNKSAIGWSLERGDDNSSVSISKFTEGLASNADGSGNITLYAVWKAGQCRVVIDLAGLGVSGAPSGWSNNDGQYSVMVDSSTDLKDVLSDWDGASISKDGYHFDGWSRTGGTINSDLTISPTFEKVDQNLLWIIGAVVALFIVGAVVVSRFKP